MRSNNGRLLKELALVGATAVWGSTFPIGKQVLEHSGPLHYLAVRFTLAALLCWLGVAGWRRWGRSGPGAAELQDGRAPAGVAAVGRRPRREPDGGARWDMAPRPASVLPDAHAWRRGAVLAGLMAGGFGLQAVGLSLTTASRSGFLTGLSIPLVPVFERLLFRGRIRRAQALAVVPAVAGTALLMAPGGGTKANLGDYLTAGCAAVFALHIVATGRFAARTPAAGLTLAQLTLSAGLLTAAAAACDLLLRCLPAPSLPPFVAAEAPGLFLSPATAWQVLYLAGAATVAAFWVQTWAQRDVPATRTAIILSLEPLFAALLSWAWLGERMAPIGLLGGALLVLAVALPGFLRTP